MLSGMSVEALVARQDTSSQQFVEQVSPISYIQRITPQEFETRFGYPPAIPLASKLDADYIEQRNREIVEGTYSPGELLPVKLNQTSLRQKFIELGHNNIIHEEKNAAGEVIQEGTEIDWYNPSEEFLNKGIRTIAMRLERRNSEMSVVAFFKENPETEEYELDETLPIINMAQDPSVTHDDEGNIVLGVVKILKKKNGGIYFKTVQFIGPDINNMKVFQTLRGKDNRPVQIDNPKQVGGFNRPQEGRGEKLGGPGKLGHRPYKTWADYKNDTRPFTEDDLLVTNFQDSNHGGPNVPLPDGQLYGHTADKEYDENGNVVGLNYRGFWALTDKETGQILYRMNYETGKLEPLVKVVVNRSDFAHLSEIPDKSEKTHNVVFMGGAKKLPNGKVRLTMGIGDARVGWKIISDPMDDVNPNNLWLVARDAT